jgi:hypothetical protein
MSQNKTLCITRTLAEMYLDDHLTDAILEALLDLILAHRGVNILIVNDGEINDDALL